MRLPDEQGGRVAVPSIVWDMDDTLCLLTPHLIEAVYKVTGKKLTDEDLTRGHWVQHHVAPELVGRVEAAIFEPHIYRNLTPSVVLHDLLGPAGAALRDSFRHHVITARRGALGDAAFDITHSWLADVGLPADGLSITHPDDNKMDAAPRGTVAVVDDSVRVIKDALDAGCYGIMVATPWNGGFKSDSRKFLRVAPEAVVTTLTELLVPPELRNNRAVQAKGVKHALA